MVVFLHSIHQQVTVLHAGAAPRETMSPCPCLIIFLCCVLSASTTSIFTPASCMHVLTCLGHHDWGLGLLEHPPHSAEQEVSTDHPWSVGLSSLLRCLVCASCMADAGTRRVQHQLLPACYFPVGSALPPAGPICAHITRPSPGNRRKPDTGKISTSPLLILSFLAL